MSHTAAGVANYLILALDSSVLHRLPGRATCDDTLTVK